METVRVKHIPICYTALKEKPHQLHFLLTSESFVAPSAIARTEEEKAVIFLTSVDYILNNKDVVCSRVQEKKLCMLCKDIPAVLTYPKCATAVCEECKMPHTLTCNSTGHCTQCGDIATKRCACKTIGYCR